MEPEWMPISEIDYELGGEKREGEFSKLRDMGYEPVVPHEIRRDADPTKMYILVVKVVVEE